MPDSWRDALREYRDQWVIGLAVALSLLAHIGLIVLIWSGLLTLGAAPTPKTLDFDLADADALDAAAQQQPDRMAYQRLAPGEKAPEKADAFGFADHDAGGRSHLADRPINEIQRDLGPRGAGQGPQTPGPGGPAGGGQRGKTPPMPGVGEGVGERPDRAATADRGAKPDPTSRSVADMISRAGMQAPPGGGGGEDGVNPYNPNVGDPGKAISISTKELKYMGYFSHMREKIYLVWVYPQDAQRSGQQGIVLLRFTIQHSGAVSDARVLKTSGYPLLDKYALKAVREANFNPMPPNWPDKELTITASFHYQLMGVRAIN